MIIFQAIFDHFLIEYDFYSNLDIIENWFDPKTKPP